jgi:hypothetical protein
MEISYPWGIPCLLLVIPTWLFVLARLRYTQIPALTPKPATSEHADCMVIIPARNEEKLIASAVSSFPKDSVIVVDDGSTDKTAQHAQASGAGVLPAPPIPGRAFGKPNACQAGASLLQSKWILFADADTSYAPGFLETVTAAAEGSKMDFISVHLPLEPSFGAELAGPYALALYYASVSPRNRPLAAFRGQCILARRAAYEFVGGHKALLGHFADATRLASAAQRHRMRFGTVRAGRLGRARFHQDDVIGGLRREMFRALDAGPAVMFWTLFTATSAALWLPCAIWLWMLDQHALALAVLPLAWLWLAGWYHDWKLIFAPLAIYIMLPILWVISLPVLTGNVPKWKGRSH